MLNRTKFNEWAKEYDTSVQHSKEGNKYPFAGYDELMDAVYTSVSSTTPLKILDIGFGTGKLTASFYADSHHITGIDFSDEMIKIASDKMPNANLIRWDFNEGIPNELKGEKFDVIVSTYAIHHLSNPAKIDFINKLKNYLADDGVIFVGDVAFLTAAKQNECKETTGDLWDDEEIYFNFDDLCDHLQFNDVSFKEISFCAGIMRLHD